MNKKQKARNILLGSVLVAVAAFSGLVFQATIPEAYAETTCAGVYTSIISCDVKAGSTGVEATGVWSLLLMVINILVAAVGIAALGGIVYGAILYAASGGNPEGVKKARTIFTNVVVGVVMFGGMYTLLNFIVPGGVFSGASGDCNASVLGVPPWYRGLTNGNNGDCTVVSPGNYPGGLQSFILKVALNVVDIAMVIVAYIAVGFIIYGGFLWLTGGAKPDMVARGRKTILNAVIGLIIAMGAIALTNLIFGIIK